MQLAFSLDAQGGGGTLFLMSGARKLEVLLDAQGRYEKTLTLPSGSSYIGFTGKGLTACWKCTLSPARRRRWMRGIHPWGEAVASPYFHLG